MDKEQEQKSEFEISDQNGNQSQSLRQINSQSHVDKTVMNIYKKYFPNNRIGFIRQSHLQVCAVILTCTLFSLIVIAEPQLNWAMKKYKIILYGFSFSFLVLGYKLFEMSRLDEFSSKRIFAKTMQALGYAIFCSQVVGEYGSSQDIIKETLSIIILANMTSIGILIYSIFNSQINKMQSLLLSTIIVIVIMGVIYFAMHPVIKTILVSGIVVIVLTFSRVSYLHSNYAYERYKIEMRNINQKRLERRMKLNQDE